MKRTRFQGGALLPAKAGTPNRSDVACASAEVWSPGFSRPALAGGWDNISNPAEPEPTDRRHSCRRVMEQSLSATRVSPVRPAGKGCAFCNALHQRVTNMKKLCRMLIVAALTCVALFQGTLCPAAGATRRPNVLLLISDNHTRTDLGCYGHPTVRTPNLDALAAGGTRFTHAYSTAPSCSPSRAVIYTGLLTHANGQYALAHSYHNGVLAKGVTTVFDMLKKDGYRTALFGKGNLGTRGGQYEMDLLDESRVRDLPALTKAAENFIREGGERPFLVVLSTHDPHPSDKPADERWKKSREPLPPRRLDPATLHVPPHLPDRADV
ncbi:MAG: hypothetical protein FJ388_04820, partial [Verrucomicrobia bacterium]|nr:hypothetical protein [Verrucomicrobiota bacterium]